MNDPGRVRPPGISPVMRSRIGGRGSGTEVRWRRTGPEGHSCRLRRGNADALAGLMARHQDRLFRYLRRLLGDETVAEDVFQQTWLQVAERISRYDPDAALRPLALRGGAEPGVRPAPRAAQAGEPRGDIRAGGGGRCGPAARRVRARRTRARGGERLARRRPRRALDRHDGSRGAGPALRGGPRPASISPQTLDRAVADGEGTAASARSGGCGARLLAQAPAEEWR